MHRVGRTADWFEIPHEQQNYWQRHAKRSNGWLTPGNAVSLCGFILVLGGLASLLYEQSWLGFALVVLGRCADLLDGAVADKTGTKSPLGEAVDATFDKFELLFALIVFFVAGVIPLGAILAVAGVNLAIAVTSVRARFLKIQLQPSRTGKVATAIQWFAISLYLLAGALHSLPVLYAAHGMIIVSVLVALVAFGLYVWNLTMRRQADNTSSGKAVTE